MVVGTIFQANLNADKICIDMTYLPDPVKHKFWLTIKNQSLVSLYFKISQTITNWSLDTPADGKLGLVSGGYTVTFAPIISRSKPGAEATDSGDLKIEAYTDAGYTNKVAEDTLAVTVYIEDLENWTDVAKSDFDDGTAQTWTLDPSAYMSISDDESVEVGGYSAKFYRAGVYDNLVSVSKSLSLPNRNKVRVSFFLAYRLVSSSSSYPSSVHDLSILADSDKVLDIPFEIEASCVTKAVGWLKVTADLSAYKGQTKTVKLQIYARATYSGWRADIWFDRIVVAGKD